MIAFFAIPSYGMSAWGNVRPMAQGFASYYTVKSCQHEGTTGVWTANGERYDETALTAALPTHRFGGFYQVCRREGPRRCVVVRQNDYGPGHRALRKGIIIDLTPAAFQCLAPRSRGIIRVTIER